jgi:hypothetical protein
MDDLIAISRDVSPSTRRSYVPESLVQHAYWKQSLLRHHIITRAPGGVSPPASSSPPPTGKELGLQLSTAEIRAQLPPGAVYYAVVGDSSQRIGDSTGLEGASMDQLFDRPHPAPASPSDGAGAHKRAVQAITSEATFFGLAPDRISAEQLAAQSQSSGTGAEGRRWTAHAPCRFGVEFWDVDALKEKSRLHSHTVFYAGSLFNVYVQVVRKKGVQLGVYLHRQSTVDPIPAASAPSTSTSTGAGPSALKSAGASPSSARPEHLTHNRGGSMPPLTPTISLPTPTARHGGLSTILLPSRSPTPAQRSTTPVSSPVRTHAGTGTPTTTVAPPFPPSYAPALPATAPAPAPEQAYRDPRPAVSAYFAIACASATGSALTRFTSAPDVFSVSQSWGWKSSSLRTVEYIDVDGDGEAPAPAGREVSLRATVVLGVV